MTTNAHESGPDDRRITPADLHGVRFTRATMLRPGYVETEVDRLVSRLAEEIGRLYAEKGQLRDQVRALQAQVDGVVVAGGPQRAGRAHPGRPPSRPRTTTSRRRRSSAAR